MKRFICTLLTGFAALLLAIPVPAKEKEIRLKTVVIDPGHGGHDPGCISLDGKTYEKDVTLNLSKRFAQKISAAYPEVKVIMTRTDDKYVTLAGRADIANKANADLFVSIHINSTDKGTSANGYSIHCLGQSSRKGNDLFSKNLDLCRRENSVIRLEDDYKTTYKGFDPSDPKSYIIFSLMQSAHLEQSLAFAEDVAESMKGGPIKTNRGVSQDPFLVLWRTTMPSVLIETGFITNPDDLSAMRSEEECDKIAAALLKAFSAFKMRYDGGQAVAAQPAEVPAAEPVVKEPEKPAAEPVQPAPEPAKAPEIYYGTQVLATSRVMRTDDSFFQGYAAKEVRSGRLYKYIVGTSDELDKARKENARIKKYFPDSFLVKVKGDTILLVR